MEESIKMLNYSRQWVQLHDDFSFRMKNFRIKSFRSKVFLAFLHVKSSFRIGIYRYREFSLYSSGILVELALTLRLKFFKIVR